MTELTYTGKTTKLESNMKVINDAIKVIGKLVDTENLYVGMSPGMFGPMIGTYFRITTPVKNMRTISDDDDEDGTDSPLKYLKCHPFINVSISGPFISTKIGGRGGWFSTTSRVYGDPNRQCEKFPPGTYIEFENDSKYESMINILSVLYISGYKEALEPLKTIIFAALSKVMTLEEGSIELVGEEKTIERILATITTTDPRLINRHILLHGSPGCGKSEIVKEIIRRTPDWIHYPLGSDSDTWEDFVKALDKLMRFLGKSALIVADEIDENGLTRAVDREKVFKLLRVLDGVGDIGHVKFIATTNRAADLDEALLRVGRLGPAIKVQKPTDEKRRMIVAFYAGRYEADVDVDWLCKELRDASGSDIRAAFENCIIYGDSLTTKNILKAFKEIKEPME